MGRAPGRKFGIRAGPVGPRLEPTRRELPDRVRFPRPRLRGVVRGPVPCHIHAITATRGRPAMKLFDDSLNPIGVVRSDHVTREAMPLGGAPAILEFFPEFETALDAVERSSHILVLGWLHRADRTVLVSRRMRIDPDVPLMGVFASRSPDRPNPVSVSVVPLLRRERRRLFVGRLDLIDGTPLLDLKSYNPGWDGVFGARRQKPVRQSALPDRMLAGFLSRDLENHFGPDPAPPEALIGLAAVFVAIREFDVDARDQRLSVRINRSDGSLDAVVGLMGGTFSSGRVTLDMDGGPLRFRFTFEGRGLALTPKEGKSGVFAEDPAHWIGDGFHAVRH